MTEKMMRDSMRAAGRAFAARRQQRAIELLLGKEAPEIPLPEWMAEYLKSPAPEHPFRAADDPRSGHVDTDDPWAGGPYGL